MFFLSYKINKEGKYAKLVVTFKMIMYYVGTDGDTMPPQYIVTY